MLRLAPRPLQIMRQPNMEDSKYSQSHTFPQYLLSYCKYEEAEIWEVQARSFEEI